LSDRTKVAVLGGGPAGIAAAYELTATDALRARYDVTVHVPGHRLGGKGGSGRDQSDHDRILEHGLHIWFGFYDNAFALMRRCYEELGRPAGAPLDRWDTAFRPCHDIVIYERWQERWVPRRVHFPKNPMTPGDPQLLDLLAGGVEWLAAHNKVFSWVGAKELGLARRLLRATERLEGRALKELGTLLSALRDRLWVHYVQERIDDDRVRFFFQNLDLLAAFVTGFGADGLLEHGCESIDDEELSAWLARHGASALTLRHSPVVRGVYDSSFAYEDGDKRRPNIAAGTAVRDAIRTLVGHRGAFFYKMQAGMGDTVFGPLYEVLRRRGVSFRFFSFVTALRPAPEGRTIDEIEVVDQVALAGRDYEPLFDVNGLPCWPSEPLWDQLQDGDRLRQAPPDFEHVADPLGRGTRVLRVGEDFDEVVLAFPPDVQRTACAAVAEANPRYAQMLDATSTVATQAFQLWFDCPLDAGLDWGYGDDSICGSFVEPLDTWCSMSQLIPRERFAPGQVGSEVYCCGVMPDAGLRNAAEANARAGADTERFLAQDATTLWPGAAGPNGSFDPAVLVDSYWRANTQPAERYVLSPAGSMASRLWPHQSGFENLALAGDWTRNGLDAGCVEASVTSGMLAAQTISGEPRNVSGIGGWLNSDPRRSVG
jgi:uncharacterized protein with NAD-binding domain and iron-sulfur cluster